MSIAGNYVSESVASRQSQDQQVATQYQSYDARGNLTTGSLGYDIYNRLVSGPSSATLAYDPVGRLYQTVGGGVTTRFLYSGAQMIAEYNGSDTLQRRFVPGPGLDEPIVQYEGTTLTDRRWLLQDERGSVIAITNSSGAASTINTYDEYGIPGSSNAGRFQYTGQAWLPEVSLYSYKARAYSPTLGRFMQTDPILFAGGMNLYAYVGNDPLNFIDPSGLCWLNIVRTTTQPTTRYPDGPSGGVPAGTVVDAFSVPITCGGFGAGGLGGPGNGPGSPVAEIDPASGYLNRLGVKDLGRPLNRCERRALWGHLPHSAITAARIHVGLPFWLPDTFAGITIGREIFFRPGAYTGNTVDDLGLLAEEVGHVGQYMADPRGWGLDYLGASMAAAVSGSDPYYGNVYEEMAQLTRQAVENELAQNGGTNGCPP